MGAEEGTIGSVVERLSVRERLEVLEYTDSLGEISLGGIMAASSEVVNRFGDVVADARDEQEATCDLLIGTLVGAWGVGRGIEERGATGSRGGWDVIHTNAVEELEDVGSHVHGESA